MISVSEKIAEISGIHAGDGYLRIRSGVEVDASGNIEEKEYYDNHVIPLFNSLFNTDIKGRFFQPRNTYGFRTHNRQIANLLIDLGFPNGKKTDIVRIPLQILNYNNENFIKRFLRGYFDTDGCLYFSNKHYKFKNKHSYPVISFTTVSKSLADDLDLIFKRLNLKFSKYLKKVKEKNWNNKTTFYFYGIKNLNKFINEIGIKNPSKYSKYLIWKKFGFCPPNISYQKRKDILSGKLDPNSFYGPIV